MKYILTSLFLSFLTPVNAESSEILFLLTKFKSSKFIENKSYMTEDGGTVLVPSTLSVKFKVLKPLQTEKEFNKKTITFLMDIETDYPLKQAEEVVLVVKKIDDNEYELLDLDIVRNVFCVYNEYIPEKESRYYYDKPWESEKNKSCTYFD